MNNYIGLSTRAGSISEPARCFFRGTSVTGSFRDILSRPFAQFPADPGVCLILKVGQGYADGPFRAVDVAGAEEDDDGIWSAVFIYVVCMQGDDPRPPARYPEILGEGIYPAGVEG